MPVILSLETSTDVCSVALHDGKKLLAQAVIQEPQAHAARLAPLVERVISESMLTAKDLDAVAVTKGPGSYTGLRIGTSTAKGLCYAMDIPLIAVGTLELLAFQGSVLNGDRALLCPMIDARRMEVYCIVTDPSLNIIQPVSAMVVDENSFSELLSDNRMLFFGNGSKKFQDVMKHPDAFFQDGVYPLATSLGEMAREKYAMGAFEDLMQFKPFYLKEFVTKRA